MYFPDLSPYTYARETSVPDVLNVGWLDRSVPFSKGGVPEQFLDLLKGWYRMGRVHPMRGIYECNLCPAVEPFLPLHQNPSVDVDGKPSFLGSCEIWIPGREKVIFASPALIIHYVDKHEYRPPHEFVSAVMNEEAMRAWNAEVEFARRTAS